MDRETLNELLLESKDALEKATAEVEQSRRTLQDGWGLYNGIRQTHESLLSWAEMYDKSSLEAKKMIVSNIVESVKLSREYVLEIDFKIGYQQYAGQSFNEDGHTYEHEEKEKAMKLA